MGPVEALGPLAPDTAAATALLGLLALRTLEEDGAAAGVVAGGGGGEEGEVITFEDEVVVILRTWPPPLPPTGPLSLRRPVTEAGAFSGAGELGGGGGHFLRPGEASKPPPMPLLLALLRARSVEPSLSNRCTIDATDNCWRNFSMTGEGDFSKISCSDAALASSSLVVAALTTDRFCWRDCARELILLLRLRGVIGLLEADGIFSRTSLGSLKRKGRER